MKKHNNKMMLVLSILLVFILAGAVSAASDDVDNNLTDSGSEDVMTLQDSVEETDTVSTDAVDENTEVLADANTVGSFSDLEKDINKDKGYQKTVYLTKDYIYNNETDSEYNTTGIYIGTYTTIDGQNHIIDAKNSAYIFNTIGKFITLKNIVFKNTSYRGINVGSSDVSIIHCTFDNNTGRAIAITDAGVTCLIDDCTFTNGQGVYTGATGTTIKNSIFENNYATNGGAFRIQSKEVTIDNCKFIKNNATNGGAVYFYYNNNDEGNEVLNIIGSTFIDNSADTGGAIYHENKFIQENSIYQGLNNIIKINSSIFTQNRAVQYREIYGNYTYDSSTIFDGGIYYQNETQIFDGITKGNINIINDITLIRGPIVLDLDGSLIINGNGHTIDANGNQAFYIKMYNTDGKLTIKNLTIKNGNATEGGAIYIASNAKYSYLEDNCMFINNTAKNGGAIYAYSNLGAGRLYVRSANFFNNSASNLGGAIYCSASERLYEVKNSIFKNNSANIGGVIYMNRATAPTIQNNIFINNSATSHAVFYNAKGYITANNNQFSDNKAMTNVLDQIPRENNDIDSSNTNVLEFNFKDNSTVKLTPGDYHIDGDIVTSANNITLDGNGAKLYNFNFQMNTGIVKNLIIINGTIGTHKSDVSLVGYIFENVTFINCTNYCLNLPEGGNVKDCTFINCSFPITNEYSVNIINTKFDDLIYNDMLFNQLNTAYTTNNTVIKVDNTKDYNLIASISIFGENITIDGQGSTVNSLFGNRVFNVYGKNITIKNFNIKNTNNVAIYFYGWSNNNPAKTWSQTNFLYTGEISGVTFTNCTTGVYFNVANGTVKDCNFIQGTGREIYFGANGTVFNSQFKNINSSSNGAAVYFTENGVVEHCEFSNIMTYNNGGAIYFTLNGNVYNTIFINNKALSGGSIYQSNPNYEVIVKKSTFDGGVAIASAGAVHCEGTLLIEDSEFTNNVADVGGAVNSVNSLTVKNATFSGNNATLAAGISSDGKEGNVTIADSTFQANTADVGAAVYSQGAGLNVTDSKFSKNTAKVMGSTVMSEGNDAVINNVTIEGNKAPSASAIVLNGDGAKISQATIKDNVATVGGGSAVIINGNNAEISGTTISGNDGKGIESNGNGTTIKDNTIENNQGSAIEINGKDSSIDNNNLTGTSGDALVINGDNTTATHNGISNTTNGSGVVINAVNSTVESNTFANNSQGQGDIIVTNKTGMTEDDIEKVTEKNTGAEVLKDSGVECNIEPSIVHVDENMTVTITTQTPGTVRILIDGKEVYAGEINESYTFVNDLLPVGDYVIFVGFTPKDATFASRNYTYNVHVQNWNFTELQDKINNPDENGTVDLGGHTYIRENGEDIIHVDAPVTINGNGSTIDAGNQASIFDVTSDDVTIKDMDLINTRDSAITSNGANTKVEGVDVVNSTGTAIKLTGENATVKDVTLDNVDNGIVVDGKGTANITGVEINDASGKAIDVTADNVNIENANLTDVIEGISANATTGNVEISGVDANNVTEGAAISATGKDVSVSNTNLTDVAQGADITATNGDAKVDNVKVDGAKSDAINVKADNGTATVAKSEVKNVDNGTAITATGKKVTMENTNLTNVTKGADITATTGDAKLDNVKVDGASDDAINVKADNGAANVSGVELTNVTGDNGLKVESETANVDDVKVDGGKGSNAVDVTTTGDAKVSNVNMTNYEGTGVNAKSDNGNVDVANTTATGGNGTVVKAEASKGNATVKGTELNNFTGKSAEVNAANATVTDTAISGGNTQAPDVNTTDSPAKVDPVQVDSDTAFDIPDTTSSTPEYSINIPGATGNFTVVVDGKDTYTMPLVDGKATIKVPELANGEHSIEVKYSGDDKFGSVSKNVSLTVSRIDISISANSASYVINYGGVYSVTLSSKVAGQKVVLTINGKKLEAITGAGGVAKFNLNKANLVSAGVKSVSVKFDGDSTYNPRSAVVKITVNKEKTKILKAKKTYKFKRSKKVKNIKVTLKNSKNNVLKKVKVIIKLSGKKIKGKKTISAKTNKKGVVTFKLAKKLTKKTNIKYTITYKGNAYYNKVTKKGKIVVK